MSRLQCQIPYTNHRDIIPPLSPFSVPRNERDRQKRQKKLICYIYEQDHHLFQWVSGPRPQQHPFLPGKGGPGQSLGQAAATWSDLDRAEAW